MSPMGVPEYSPGHSDRRTLLLVHSLISFDLGDVERRFFWKYDSLRGFVILPPIALSTVFSRIASGTERGQECAC